MNRTRGLRTVVLCLFSLLLAGWIKAVPANPAAGKKNKWTLTAYIPIYIRYLHMSAKMSNEVNVHIRAYALGIE